MSILCRTARVVWRQYVCTGPNRFVSKSRGLGGIFVEGVDDVSDSGIREWWTNDIDKMEVQNCLRPTPVMACT